ncbi:hypothetical protein CPB83DRAFT_447178 [Crepidotus variabilis]|uniref:HMG box domain-containing protein n=1 Tax=Crepidotus variabilis TaxID=179855 RepID=A0A9P6ECW6_9AGAR|nr:hypothetical protein CPB83DRAFT_447178 [Crepidotus variabilis]
MSGFGGQFTLSPQLSPASNSPPGMHSASANIERRDERASRSGSDEGCYGRAEQAKIEGEEDSNTLTSQTLNADGTPKRPMNAFMIFARRRRPQVSAENQSMRTGEISKILSKEWVSMQASDKQFYLEQAKQLKETFNTKYPDYVYRRRPNNSRKRRRSDSGASRTVDQGLFPDNPDDFGAGYELDVSPTDGDDFQDAPHPSPYSRHTHGHEVAASGIHTKYSSQPHRGSISQSFSPTDPPFRSNGHETNRVSFTGSGTTDRVNHSVDPNDSPRMSLNNMHYSYNHTTSHPPTPPIFGAESQQNWQPRNGQWMTSSERLPGPPPNPKSNSYSPPTTWSNPSDSPVSSHSQPSNQAGFFPTLNTPFYPNQPNVQPYPHNTSTNHTQPLPTQPSQFDEVNTLENTMPREFNSRMYPSPSSPVVSSPNSSYPLNRDSAPFSQRILPPMQTLSYSHPPSLASPSANHPNSQPAFWRD